MEVSLARVETVHILDFAPVVAFRTPDERFAIVAARAAPAEELPSGVMALTVLLYAVLFAAFGWGFSGGPAIGAIAGVAIVAFALMREFGSGVGEFMNGMMATATGPISGRAAVALVLTVPTCLATAALVIAIAFRAMQ